MPGGKAPGIDGLPMDFYKFFWKELGEDLLEVLEESCRERCLPLSSRRTVITLLPKKGDHQDIKNWRPVSLLCTDYKVMSKALANRLRDIMDSVIQTDQTYCVPSRSIIDNVSLIRDILDVSRSLAVDLGLISLDQEKAFDRVEHQYLWKTLEAFGLSPSLIAMMKNNLHDPNQSGLKAAHSTETALLAVTEKLHAARSAKLSSVLILLHLSAAFDTVNHKTLLSTLRSLGICGTAWEWFASYLDGRSYQVTWKGLTSAPRRLSTGVPQGSVLGTFQYFSSHVANGTRSCRFLLYNIRRIRPFLSTQATRVLVQSLVISRLDYCYSLLAGLPLNAIRPLQMIQNAAAPLVFNLPKFSHTTPLLRSLHWLPVAARIRFKKLMLAYKAKNGSAPFYLKTLITPCTAPRFLKSTSTARLVPPSLREKGPVGLPYKGDVARHGLSGNADFLHAASEVVRVCVYVSVVCWCPGFTLYESHSDSMRNVHHLIHIRGVVSTLSSSFFCSSVLLTLI
ncbi:hypothetical protein QTP70_009454 [Hemibagrus guttatus]|uniref:Reverse transcriptase domain-containing protein n=1 Tax=Hemibagrus guttatus TaxID=175788 RepID=A0AAE0RKW7_9TELE|nr:hypothetical protein QTP70_009454 [Hemibagrus guttatus]